MLADGSCQALEEEIDDSPSYTTAELEKKTCAELARLCVENGLTKGGNKATLVRKLLNPDNPRYFTRQRAQKEQQAVHRGVYPCRQFLLMLALCKVEEGAVLDKDSASAWLPTMSLGQIALLLNTVGGRLSVNPQRNACLQRATTVLMRGKNVHLSSKIRFWYDVTSCCMIVSASVLASMHNECYNAFLLFQWTKSGDEITCNLVRWYCECHYGFTLHCGHKAVLLLSIGILQGNIEMPRYQLDKHFETVDNSKIAEHLQSSAASVAYLTSAEERSD